MVPGSFTVTSQIAVTFALACLVILTVIVTGFVKHGIGFLKLFVPHAPWYLLILLVPIEVISFLTRPISLSVRLFANMLAGHTMLAVFAGFVVALGGAGGVLSRPVDRAHAADRRDHAAGTAGGVPAGLCLRHPDLHLSQRSTSSPRSSLNQKGNTTWTLHAAKMIGAGIACIALVGAGIGIGNVFGSYLSGALRNPGAAATQTTNLLLGFALCEATGLFGLVIALIILFAF